MQEPSEMANNKRVSVKSAQETLSTNIDGLKAVDAALSGPLGSAFEGATELIFNLKGRLILVGVGKSGHISAKLSATLSSTGTPAFYVHPTEASHGDLGMIAQDDIVLALSWSGETKELADVINHTRRFSVPLIAITAGPESALAKAADIALVLPQVREACPHNLAPTTSTLMQLALGDALAISLLEKRGFTEADFKTLHPGGKLGASLKAVSEIMHLEERLPLVSLGTSMSDAIVEMTAKSFGIVGVIDDQRRLQGVITDGDLRRHIETDMRASQVNDVMSKTPKTITGDLLAAQALEMMQSNKISSLFVIEDGKPIGIIHLLDLLREGVV